MVARLSKHVEEASSRKSQTQRFIDNFAQSTIFLQVSIKYKLHQLFSFSGSKGIKTFTNVTFTLKV